MNRVMEDFIRNGGASSATPGSLDVILNVEGLADLAQSIIIKTACGETWESLLRRGAKPNDMSPEEARALIQGFSDGIEAYYSLLRTDDRTPDRPHIDLDRLETDAERVNTLCDIIERMQPSLPEDRRLSEAGLRRLRTLRENPDAEAVAILAQTVDDTIALNAQGMANVVLDTFDAVKDTLPDGGASVDFWDEIMALADAVALYLYSTKGRLEGTEFEALDLSDPKTIGCLAAHSVEVGNIMNRYLFDELDRSTAQNRLANALEMLASLLIYSALVASTLLALLALVSLAIRLSVALGVVAHLLMLAVIFKLDREEVFDKLTDCIMEGLGRIVNGLARLLRRTPDTAGNAVEVPETLIEDEDEFVYCVD